MAQIGGTGSKGKSISTETTDQTRTNTLSDRAAGMFTDGINDARGMRYGRFDPSTGAQYESPYTEDVINATLDQSDQRDAIARNQQRSDMAGAGAFGDKRRGIYEAEMDGNQSRDRASLIAGMRDKGFTDARTIAQGENQNENQFNMMMQQLLAQLRGGFANEGTQTLQGTSTAKGKTSNVGLSFGYGGGS